MFGSALRRFEEYVDEEGEQIEGEEGEDAAARPAPTTTTTTEAPKKIRPSIRPFRSNDDLLTALKKRRLESKNSKPGKQAAEAALHLFSTSIK
ncbi:AAEL002736-PA [Aedes aegypti]|uniref:AAEL002736-PA n=1 Tax=Aedes aegypti TaxID=7159 RepID=Q17HB0_AEDAE|nr:AAEL002736-PA [Aedes aegypti]